VILFLLVSLCMTDYCKYLEEKICEIRISFQYVSSFFHLFFSFLKKQ